MMVEWPMAWVSSLARFLASIDAKSAAHHRSQSNCQVQGYLE
ncbi:hypothetical protein [Janthinobacterium sp.]|nr:hypothetical protein [Janthinobacterium sp.]